MLSTPPNDFGISLSFGSVDRQRGLDAMLRIAPDSRPLPYSGGRFGKAGTAVLGFGSIPPRTIWCISPTLRSGIRPADSLRCAIWQGLQRAALNDLQRVGVPLQTDDGIIVPWPEVVDAAIHAAADFAGEAGVLDEIRFIFTDSRVMIRAQEILELLHSR